MTALAAQAWPTWALAVCTIGGIVVRPFGLPEWVWAVAAALLLVACRLLPVSDALTGVAAGTDVYLFLGGMMLLAELARIEGLFDWLAAKAARLARGSAPRLFTLVYAVGTLVTIFLSNDATAVVLTPAVVAVVQAAKAPRRLPYVLVCAFIANAASFVLPISNPANLVVYGVNMPPLGGWLRRYTVPSVLSVGATYLVLLWTQRRLLRAPVASDVPVPNLGAGGKLAALGILGTGAVLLTVSAFDLQLGLPTFLAGLATALLVRTRSRFSFTGLARGISWGVLPLVAGLFVLVQALERTGAADAAARLLRAGVRSSPALAAWISGLALGFGCNVVNNLPAGLMAGRVLELAAVPEKVRSAILIGTDLGPNLSVTGSLATILWLAALRREGVRVSAWSFLAVGAVVMPPALLLALGGVLAFR